MKKLSECTENELLKWYEYVTLQNAKKCGTAQIPSVSGVQSNLIHDVWSVYDYGDIVKVVYIKSAPKRKDGRDDKLFPDLKNQSKKPKFEKLQRDENERFSNSISRSKARVFELAMCNEFKYFCTFTQDEKKRDRFDLKEFRKDFAQFVRNLNRGREEKIKYLLIPEQHKNGAWHMHGFLMGLNSDDLRLFTLNEKLPERIRKPIAKGVAIYDWTAYRRKFGYFTCTEIDNHTACAKYITKYISKDFQKSVRESGEHLFFASQGLKGREAIVKNSLDKCPFDEWDFENDYVKIKEINYRTLSQKTDSKKI